MFGKDSAIPIRDDIFWIGGDDRTATIFEGAFPIPEGISYNSYLICSEGKTCLLDTVDASIAAKFWKNLRNTLDGRPLDYLVINHMEPDHGACITQVLETWPEVTVVGNAKTFEMLYNYHHVIPANKLEVKEGDAIQVGDHSLRFYFAVMVHWPEVMFTYDEKERILFSADAFGSFKALSGALYADETDFDRDYLEEARRYYSNIVGKYGAKVQQALAKLKDVPIDTICPLHGPIWRKDLGYIIGKYDLWSRYELETRGVMVAYTSIYGNTAALAEKLALMLKEKGVENVAVHSMTAEHPSYAVADAFRFSHMVLAATTYNNHLHPSMSSTIEDMEIMAVQNRCYSVIGNGSWVPQADKVIEDRLSKMKNMTKIGETLTIKSSLAPDQLPALEKLASDIAASVNQ